MTSEEASSCVFGSALSFPSADSFLAGILCASTLVLEEAKEAMALHLQGQMSRVKLCQFLTPLETSRSV